MTCDSFRTETGTTVPTVSADQMREIDRVAVEEIGLGLLQMMENAGRNLALQAREWRAAESVGATPVAVLAGGGGNGGGGLCAARHLVNRDVPVRVVLDRNSEELSGTAATQFGILREMDVEVTDSAQVSDASADPRDALSDAGLLVDAIIGYSLRGAPRGAAEELIRAANDTDAPILSLDVPSGYDATTGETPGVAIAPTETLTLALPKTGLDAVPGDLSLADIAVPATVYERVGVEYESPLRDRYRIELRR